MNTDEYEPFGTEWVTEIMRMTKAHIVEMLMNVCKENVRLRQQADKGAGHTKE